MTLAFDIPEYNLFRGHSEPNITYMQCFGKA